LPISAEKLTTTAETLTISAENLTISAKNLTTSGGNFVIAATNLPRINSTLEPHFENVTESASNATVTGEMHAANASKPFRKSSEDRARVKSETAGSVPVTEDATNSSRQATSENPKDILAARKDGDCLANGPPIGFPLSPPKSATAFPVNHLFVFDDTGFADVFASAMNSKVPESSYKAFRMRDRDGLDSELRDFLRGRLSTSGSDSWFRELISDLDSHRNQTKVVKDLVDYLFSNEQESWSETGSKPPDLPANPVWHVGLPGGNSTLHVEEFFSAKNPDLDSLEAAVVDTRAGDIRKIFRILVHGNGDHGSPASGDDSAKNGSAVSELFLNEPILSKVFEFFNLDTSGSVKTGENSTRNDLNDSSTPKQVGKN
jgi:hypothetical protein